jgi:hypothetical protein
MMRAYAHLQVDRGGGGADPRRYQALAHKYALYLHNQRPDKDGEPTRMQRHCGRVPDFGDKNGMIPYVFVCITDLLCLHPLWPRRLAARTAKGKFILPTAHRME